MPWSHCRWFNICVVLVIAGCWSGSTVSKERLEKMSGGTLKKVVPIKGKILIDGSPEKNVYAYWHRPDSSKPNGQSVTNDKGEYCFTSYTTCDGLEPGQYKLTFQWIKKAELQRKGTDLLKGRYSNLAKTEYSVTVVEGQPQTSLNFELTTK